MKKIIAMALSFLMIVFCAGCSDGGSHNDSDKTGLGIDVIVFGEGTDTIDAQILKVDIESGALELSPNTVFTFDKSSAQDISLIYPQYMTENFAVFRQTPLSVSENYASLSETEEKTLFFEEYILTYDSEAFSLLRADDLIYENVSLKLDETSLIPASFFVDQDGKVILMGMTSASLIETEMASVVYAENNGTLEIDQFIVYTTIWDDYDISKALCPNNLSGSVNVWAYPSLQGFIYNETTKVLLICPYSGDVKCIIEESDIAESMSFFDAYREFYSLFSGAGYGRGVYAAAFQALNEIPGTYTALFDEQGNYAGYLLCRSDGISLFDKTNREVSKIEGSFLPITYIPSF